MASYTTNYNLEKPSANEFYNIAKTNANMDKIDGELKKTNDILSAKIDMVFGTYIGDGTENRVINLGFTPVAVEVYCEFGGQGEAGNDGLRDIYGGLAMTGKPCGGNYNGERLNAIEIVKGGFKVGYKSIGARVYGRTNVINYIYYFKVYKNGEIMEV